jgi:DNA-binding GntR family transcriptional regulator
VLHYRDLLKSEIQTGPGYKYTRPLRTMLDLIEADTVERTFIRQALRQAADRGLITRQQIQNAEMTETVRKMVEDALRRAA